MCFETILGTRSIARWIPFQLGSVAALPLERTVHGGVKSSARRVNNNIARGSTPSNQVHR